MKKLTLFAILLLTSCTFSPEAPTQTSSVDYGDYTIKVIDGCEYLEYYKGFADHRVYSLTHKGNCKNPIHICKCNTDIQSTKTNVIGNANEVNIGNN